MESVSVLFSALTAVETSLHRTSILFRSAKWRDAYPLFDGDMTYAAEVFVAQEPSVSHEVKAAVSSATVLLESLRKATNAKQSRGVYGPETVIAMMDRIARVVSAEGEADRNFETMEEMRLQSIVQLREIIALLVPIIEGLGRLKQKYAEVQI